MHMAFAGGVQSGYVIANFCFSDARCVNRAVPPPHRLRSPLLRQHRLQQQVCAASPGLLQKLGRVLKEKAQGDLDRIRSGTSKTRERLGVVEELFAYWSLEDADDTLEELEEALISADFGPKTSLRIVDQIRTKVKHGKIKTGEQIRSELKKSILQLLRSRGGNTDLKLSDRQPSVILIVGVNGGGKTTTIGKLAHKFNSEGVKVLLGAGDTFRAAAAEQLTLWADRSGVDVHTIEGKSVRPDNVLYQTVDRAIKEEYELVICDTSGRLHTNWSLMEELAKCKRSISKRLSKAPHETLLVLDGTTGLNMLNQARQFNEDVKLTGIVLTKLDGTARGGAVVSVVDELGLPVKFVGVGETVADLQPFNAEDFVDALFPASNPEQ